MTTQASELLLLDGRLSSMRSRPLDAYLDPRGMNLSKLSGIYCTGLYRGYLGTWEVHDDHLYLIALLDAMDQPFDAEALFEGRRLPIRADWFTGRIDVDRGELLDCGGGWSSIYARRLFLYVEQGRVIKRRSLRQTRRLQRRYACTFQEYADWRRERGGLVPVGGLTAAGFAALGWPASEDEAPWPADDADSDMDDRLERLLPFCHRPGVSITP